MTMAEALTYLASYYTYEQIPDYQAHITCVEKALKAYAQWDKDKYWEMVNEVIEHDRNLIALYHQPQYIRCWEYTKQKWINDSVWEASYADHPDRQTDELPGNAFVN